MQDIGDEGASDAVRVDAVVVVEAAVLDGDECLRHITWHFPQRQGRAGAIAAARERAVLHVHNLDRRRAPGDFQPLDGLHVPPGPDDDADTGDAEPETGDQTPVGNAAEARADATGRALLAATALARLRRRAV